MKRYHVLIHADAEDELDKAYRHITENAPERAARWRRQLLKKAQSLKPVPDRCPKAPEAITLGEDVRHLIVGNYRIVFVIQADTVTVLHIRHGAGFLFGAPRPPDNGGD
jgi:toxin ParE1/3/4